MTSRLRRRTRGAALPAIFLLVAGCRALVSGDTANQVQRALEDLSRQGLTSEVGGRPLALTKFAFSELYVDGRDAPEALMHVQASGTWGEATLGYYGSERVAFTRREGRLAPRATWLPRLEGVLSALAARDAALAAKDPRSLAELAGPNNHDGAITLQRVLGSRGAAARERASSAGPASLSIRVEGTHAQVSQVGDPFEPRESGPRSAELVQVGDSWRFTTGLL
jgi:hypothetical protein